MKTNDMTNQVVWEYRVLTIGSAWGTKDENIEATLNEWGQEGWEAVAVYTPYGSGKVTLTAKRPLSEAERRRRARVSRETPWSATRQLECSTSPIRSTR